MINIMHKSLCSTFTSITTAQLSLERAGADRCVGTTEGQRIVVILVCRRIAIQYHSWSAKGFGEAMELLIADC